MKRVYLFRHGKAEKRGEESTDFQRTLIEKGREDAARIGAELKRNKMVPEKILSSSAVRALESAQICATAANYGEDIEALERLYAASPEEYMDVLRSMPSSLKSVMLVGHNPEIEEFNEALMGTYRKLKTSYLIWYDIETEEWSDVEFSSEVLRSGLIVP